ncbi:hypothetical protein [Bradyrhizobium canariense]|uniref:hypothetical protein n=1 Tax=Bradyrhizobium canariense TaxID=255045 RepID=UPI001FDA81D5|nr:hypothetical protein [Bradyrhizobium canariense]
MSIAALRNGNEGLKACEKQRAVILKRKKCSLCRRWCIPWCRRALLTASANRCSARLRRTRGSIEIEVGDITIRAGVVRSQHGRTRFQPPKREGALPQKAPRPIEEWRIVVKDRYPAYIDWPNYEQIRAVNRDNRAEYMRIKTRGAPRNGELLLHGIAWCARCDHKMYVRYKGGGEYVCNHLRTQEGKPICQHNRANRSMRPLPMHS